jgi:hypothetical protein
MFIFDGDITHRAVIYWFLYEQILRPAVSGHIKHASYRFISLSLSIAERAAIYL